MSGILQLVNTFPSGGFAVKNSLRFRSSASAYLSRTPASAGNRTTWTYSYWTKLGTVNGSTPQMHYYAGPSSGYSYYSFINIQPSGTITFAFYFNSGTIYYLNTTQVLRDPSAWYHLVFVADTTNATASDRIRIYVNNVRVTSFASAIYPPQNFGGYINSTELQEVGGQPVGFGYSTFDGYMAEINFIDGQALDPSSFGAFDATSGVWQATKYSGTYGTNGFYLKFSDTTSTTTLCYDYSGNSNNWTPNNISLSAGSTYDSMLDSPTNYDNGGNGVGNYAVLNPLQTSTLNTISNGNLTASNSNSSTGFTFASVSLGTGTKFYFEATATGTAQQIGIFSSNQALTPTGSKRYWYLESGGIYNDATLLQSVSTFTSGDVISVAWDGVAQTVTFYKNNTQQGTAVSVDTSYSYFFGVGVYNGGWNVNFGQRPFAYTPPTGYKALNTQNLPAPSIQNGSNFMAATLYTGNGTSQSLTNTVNGISFQPDFVWLKSRSNAYSHKLFDSVRGVYKELSSDSTAAEATDTNQLTAFNANGWSVGSGLGSNGNGSTFVGWQWKAGGTAVTNTAGSITSSVSANTTSGFSVATFTCNAGGSGTFGHGLSIAPSMVIIKSRTSSAQSWVVGHTSIAWTNYLLLNQTGASSANASVWNNTAPSSTVVTLGSGFTNANYGDCVAYCFVAIPGYSAFGSYTGNGSTDGPFVYCGFRPRYVMVKKTSSSGGDWPIMDTSRGTYNAVAPELYADLSQQETNSSFFDILSNGFKARATGQQVNANGDTYIYAAFAENPLKYSLAR